MKKKLVEKKTIYMAFIESLLNDAKEVVGVGTGGRARLVREFIVDKLRIKPDNILFGTSYEVPVSDRIYLVCATPEDDAVNVLIDRGISEENILLSGALCEFADRSGLPLTFDLFGLFSLSDKLRMASLLFLKNDYLCREVYADKDIEEINFIFNKYMEVREYYSSKIEVRAKRLLFPAAGTSGGKSISFALEELQVINLEICYEGFASQIYSILSLYRSGKVNRSVMVSLTAMLLDRYDCHGGNPFCFLIPYIKDIPLYDYYILKVDRKKRDHIESMAVRNFHYSEKDYVPNRITAVEWGSETKDVWDNRSLEDKIEWYIDLVEEQISEADLSSNVFVRCFIKDIKKGLNVILNELGWPKVNSVPHLNSIPNDKVYSYSEREKLYSEINCKRSFSYRKGISE